MCTDYKPVHRLSMDYTQCMYVLYMYRSSRTYSIMYTMDLQLFRDNTVQIDSKTSVV